MDGAFWFRTMSNLPFALTCSALSRSESPIWCMSTGCSRQLMRMKFSSSCWAVTIKWILILSQNLILKGLTVNLSVNLRVNLTMNKNHIHVARAAVSARTMTRGWWNAQRRRCHLLRRVKVQTPKAAASASVDNNFAAKKKARWIWSSLSSRQRNICICWMQIFVQIYLTPCHWNFSACQTVRQSRSEFHLISKTQPTCCCKDVLNTCSLLWCYTYTQYTI